MSDKILVAIPSYKRSFLLKENRGVFSFIKYLNKDLTDLKYFLNITDNLNYAGLNDDLIDKNNVLILDKQFISHVIYDIIQYAFENNYTHLLILEDDCRYRYRPQNEYMHKAFSSKTTLDLKLLNKLFSFLISLCGDESNKFQLTSPITGIGSFRKYFYLESDRITFNTVCLNVKALKSLDLDFLKKLAMKEDYFIFLSLLSKGYRTLCSSDFTAQDLKRNYKGGAQTYRTEELYNQQTYLLYDYFKYLIELEIVKKDYVKEWGNKYPLYELKMMLKPKVHFREEIEPLIEHKDYFVE
jgi:hypothetical protein